MDGTFGDSAGQELVGLPVLGEGNEKVISLMGESRKDHGDI